MRIVIQGLASGTETLDVLTTQLALVPGCFDPTPYVERAMSRAVLCGLEPPLRVVDFRAVDAAGRTIMLPLPRPTTPIRPRD